MLKSDPPKSKGLKKAVTSRPVDPYSGRERARTSLELEKYRRSKMNGADKEWTLRQ